MKWYIRIPLTLTCAFLLLGMMDSVVLSGINQPVMAGLFEDHALIRGHDEVSRSDLPEIASGIIKYLKTGSDGDIPRLRGEILFSGKENLHLKDCAAIIRGMTAFRTVFIVMLLVLCAGGVVLRYRQDGKRLRALSADAGGCLAAACMGILGVFLLLAGWGIVDFNGLFLAFHRLFFRNDLWILDPSRDLLIQLMPYGFFVSYASRLLMSLLPCMALMVVFPLLYIRSGRASGSRGEGPFREERQ